MSILNLSGLFAPRSVAVIGASEKPLSLGNIVMRNLLAGRFNGPIMPVHPDWRSVTGVLAYPTVHDLPLAPDLAVLCVPGAAAPELIDELGQRGTRAVILAADDADPAELLAAARPYGIRILGGSSFGVVVPRAHLNASFAHLSAKPGRVAFVAQSGALCAAVLDWAEPRDIGFSCVISLGDSSGIGFADVLDYLSSDDDTKAILLHIEEMVAGREFMSAARAAARNKPVVLTRGGRIQRPGGPIGPFLAEALAAPDETFSAAVGRSGALRVDTVDELFGAVETLARSKQIRGERLAILSNGGGAARIALDEINSTTSGEATELAPETLERLARLMPDSWTPGNPVDLGVKAPADLYESALEVLFDAGEVDGVLVVHSPNPLVDPREVALRVIGVQKRMDGPVLACWLGGKSADLALRLFSEVGLPNFNSIGAAIHGFGHLVQYRRNQAMLMETPPADPAYGQEGRKTARDIILRGLERPGSTLSDPDTRALIAAYGIPTVESTFAATAEEAAEAAARVGFPVALTISSPDLPREWDVGGVALNIETAEAVLSAAEGILGRVQRTAPHARIEGFAVQPMVLRPNSRQLLMGIACDPLFGPVLVFGEGGRAVELVRDHIVALPPLNMALARQLIARTRLSPQLDAHGLRPAANRDAIAEALVRLSAMLVENPEIVACDINPLFCDENGVIAVDARIRVAAMEDGPLRRFSILPYPAGLEEHATLYDGSEILLRPIRPEDEPAHADLVSRMSPEDLRYRFFGATQKLRHHQLARLTQIDYDREMAFIATRNRAEGQPETLGVVRTSTDSDNRRAELAILVRSDLKGTGLGRTLLDKIVRYHRERGTAEIGAQVLTDNEPMLRLARRGGFDVHEAEEHGIMECRLDLT